MTKNNIEKEIPREILGLLSFGLSLTCELLFMWVFYVVVYFVGLFFSGRPETAASFCIGFSAFGPFAYHFLKSFETDKKTKIERLKRDYREQMNEICPGINARFER